MHKKRNPFEPLFHDFIRQFGGEVLVEASTSKTADYLFRNQNIVAELKCLMEDQTAAMNAKLNLLVQVWAKENKQLLPISFEGGTAFLSIRDAPKEIQTPWVEILRAPISDLIREANKQIRYH